MQPTNFELCAKNYFYTRKTKSEADSKMNVGKLVGGFTEKSEGILYKIILIYRHLLKCYAFYSVKMFLLRKISDP